MDYDAAVLSLASRIPPGRVSTYGEIASALGNRNLARVVGGALHRNPLPIEIPCHRVVRSDGSLGGYSRGLEEKAGLLEAEGVVFVNGRIRDLEKVLYRF
ncbi:MAG: MGMT family protein [Candidatus Altiarchaeota archaeon]|nr:MGMT family protein [Candidatus Altiarchaeota archaeon]